MTTYTPASCSSHEERGGEGGGAANPRDIRVRGCASGREWEGAESERATRCERFAIARSHLIGDGSAAEWGPRLSGPYKRGPQDNLGASVLKSRNSSNHEGIPGKSLAPSSFLLPHSSFLTPHSSIFLPPCRLVARARNLFVFVAFLRFHHFSHFAFHSRVDF